MIDRQQLLKDLQRLLRQLEGDLRGRCEVAEVGEAVKAEYDKAQHFERTALSFEDWRTDYITQIGAAWILSCVFARFLEDNELVDPPKLSGPGERLQRARDEYDLYVHQHPAHTVREYLLAVFDSLGKLPGAKEIFGGHTPIHQQRTWLSGDAAKELRNFWQQIDPATGNLIHDFTDAQWDTRFLGDLYQDLSETARKKYALLQTPEFVEEFILDRTLEPALEEFGLNAPRIVDEREQPITEAGFRMIDPACGSGHFLLGAFPRILKRWQRQEPGTNVRELVQRTLDSIHGVDINPFAIAIARFRLLLAALAACGVRRLTDAPAFAINLACGDSLYHGVERQQTLGDWTDESHYFRTEDATELRCILKEGTFHCVVANPPYITPKDKAANNAYRRLYSSCHRQYSLAVPFMERIFGLAVPGRGTELAAGFTGQITANSFMKREFGTKLVKDFLPQIDVLLVVDTSGAHIPGHGTPTLILVGRNRRPVADSVRGVLGIRGEPSTPDDPAEGQVWRAIEHQVDIVGSETEFISVEDIPRTRLRVHPWTLMGGGSAQVKSQLDRAAPHTLSSFVTEFGAVALTRFDEAYVVGVAAALRSGVHKTHVRAYYSGESIRDYQSEPLGGVIWPYIGDSCEPADDGAVDRFLWRFRTPLRIRVAFGKTHLDHGLRWTEYSMLFRRRYGGANRIAFTDVGTHNHFSIATPDCVFNSHAPIIVFRDDVSDDDRCALLGILNSSTACFWMKQNFQTKGSSGIGRGVYDESWEKFYEFTPSGLMDFPLPAELPKTISKQIRHFSDAIQKCEPKRIVYGDRDEQGVRERLSDGRADSTSLLSKMMWAQEEIDWYCYRCFGLTDEDLSWSGLSPVPLSRGERPFEIKMARRVADGDLDTSWFERHGSQPITELPDHWPDDYKQLVQRRIDIIESNPQIALIEQPEYKRRWNTEPWDSQVQRALRSWLLDRLESYFDFDGRMNDEGRPTNKIDIGLISVARLTDIAANDAQFMEVAEVYRDRSDFDTLRLVAELVESESAPLGCSLHFARVGVMV